MPDRTLIMTMTLTVSDLPKDVRVALAKDMDVTEESLPRIDQARPEMLADLIESHLVCEHHQDVIFEGSDEMVTITGCKVTSAMWGDVEADAMEREVTDTATPACDCQSPPTHCSEDCPIHGWDNGQSKRAAP